MAVVKPGKLTTADNAIGKVSNECRNPENSAGSTKFKKTPLANSR